MKYKVIVNLRKRSRRLGELGINLFINKKRIIKLIFLVFIFLCVLILMFVF